MGQLRLIGADAAAALESLVPVDVHRLAAGQQRYAFFTNATGGILDDLMITRRAQNDLLLVVNAACKEADTAPPADPHRPPLHRAAAARAGPAGAAGPEGRRRRWRG